MTGTTVSTSGTIGISLTSSSQNPVTVKSTGTINVSGSGYSAIYGAYGVPGVIANDGLLQSLNGYAIRLLSGGNVTNGGTADTKAKLIGGEYGIRFGVHGTGIVTNFGTIISTGTAAGMGVDANASANVVNGSASDTTALISGYYDGVRISGPASTVVNFATIASSGVFSTAVYLRTGGSVINGSTADTAATIAGNEFGVLTEHGFGTVTNFGTIAGTSSAFGRGIVLADGGSLVNGSNADTKALISSAFRNGIYIGGVAESSVANFGTIVSTGPVSTSSNGIAIRPGATIVNGSASDTAASIIATRQGVYISGSLPSAVINFGTIQSFTANGLSLYLGASVTNGSAADTVAVIKGPTAIYEGGPATITNFATLNGFGTAIVLAQGGGIVNGSTLDTAALIIGGTGIQDRLGAATVSNFGRITGTAGSAIVLSGGGNVLNGGAKDITASITATSTAVSVGVSAGTVANYGLISGNAIGIALAGGGIVTNGSATDKSAVITSVNTGIFSGAARADVVTFGTVVGTNNTGIQLAGGGSVTNGAATDTTAAISGSLYGIRLGLHAAAGTVVNFGSIANTSTSTGAGIEIVPSGTVVNGSAGNTGALISGYSQGVDIRGPGGTVINFGKIAAGSSFGSGVYLRWGGTVVNGSASNTTASIVSAQRGIQVTHLPGTVANYGTIKGIGPYSRGIDLFLGGTVVNGSTADTAAYISASDRNGVYAGGTGFSSVTNFGTIKGLGPVAISSGVVVRGNGSVVNGSTADVKATIFGTRNGVYIQGLSAASVDNFGTIIGAGKSGVNVYLGGSVTNGTTVDTKALITGSTGVLVGQRGSVTNFGTILSTGKSGVSLNDGGMVLNGSTTDTTALIAMAGTTGTHNGIYADLGVTTVTNFGTITSSTASGIHLGGGGGTIVNGALTDKVATIAGPSGHAGIYADSGAATVTNFGTITTKGLTAIALTNGTQSASGIVINAGTISNGAGTAGTAIVFGSGNDRLVVDPGAVFIGTVNGGGGLNTLELAAGTATGSIGGIGTQFSNFGSVAVDPAAVWSLTGTNTAAVLTNAGTLDIAASASLLVTGSIDPASTGLFEINAGSLLEIAANTGTVDSIRFLGTGEAIIDHAASFGIHPGTTSYAGPLIEGFGINDKIDLKDVAFASVGTTYNATTGLLTIRTGTVGVASLLFDKATLGTGTFHTQNDGTGHTLIIHN